MHSHATRRVPVDIHTLTTFKMEKQGPSYWKGKRSCGLVQEGLFGIHVNMEKSELWMTWLNVAYLHAPQPFSSAPTGLARGYGSQKPKRKVVWKGR